MNVNRHVVTDLLPLYLSGEAHADTRMLVDEYLRSDPEFARLVEKQRGSSERWQAPPDFTPGDAAEVAAFTRARSAVRRAVWLRALALSGVALLLAAAGAWSRLVYNGPALERIVRVTSDAGQILFPLFLLALVIQFYRRRTH